MAAKNDTADSTKDPAQELASQDIIQLVERLPAEKRLELVKVLEFSIQSTFSGPLPSPEDFARYNETLPDAANRILTMAEKEQQMRSDRQAGVLANDRTRINRATLLGLSLIVVAGIATYLGQVEIALPLGLGGTVAALSRQIMDWLDRRQATKSTTD